MPPRVDKPTRRASSVGQWITVISITVVAVGLLGVMMGVSFFGGGALKPEELPRAPRDSAWERPVPKRQAGASEPATRIEPSDVLKTAGVQAGDAGDTSKPDRVAVEPEPESAASEAAGAASDVDQVVYREYRVRHRFELDFTEFDAANSDAPESAGVGGAAGAAGADEQPSGAADAAGADEQPNGAAGETAESRAAGLGDIEPGPSRALCGPATCNVGQVCCNPSCGICVSPGQSCDQTPCSNPITTPMSQRCGMATCNVDEFCCNPSCGICVEKGQSCSQEPCD